MNTKIILIFIFIFSLYFFTSQSEKHEGVERVNEEIPSAPDDDWFETQRAFPFSEIPNDERIKSIEYVRNNMQTDAPPDSPDWTLAGPTNIEGRITDLAIHPTNPQIVYAATANGGVWKSTNFCQTWVSVFDNQNTSSIGTLVLDPSNPNIIYVGTGEANSSRSTYSGIGVYKSTDGGNSWSFSGLDSSFYIGRLTINPSNTQELYCAVMGYLRRKNPERGIYRTTNGGINWTQSLFVADSVGAIDVALDPSNPSKVFAAMWERTRREDGYKYGGPMSALYRTTNSGANWAIVNSGFPSNNSTLGRISLSICSSNSQIIYALVGSYNELSGKGCYKSTDGGNNWVLVNTAFGNSSQYTWYNRICSVSPSNSNLVLCGDLYMDISTNGGTSYTRNYNLHADQHAVAFAPSNPNYVVAGNDGGIYTSTNAGSTWNRNPSLPITQFVKGDVDYTNPNQMMGGAQDNGILRTPNGALNNWTDIFGGDGCYCVFDYTNSQRMYAESQNGYMGYSVNGGSSFSFNLPPDMTWTNWSTPIILDKNNPQIIYTGTYKIFRSTNGMQSWTTISGDMASRHANAGSSTFFGTVTTIDVSKSNPSVIYCGTDDANVWVTTNTGTNWTKINTGLPYRWVTRVTTQPDSANICYVTLSGYKVDSTGSHIYRTTNYGSSWTSIKGNLPDAPINDVVVDPSDFRTLYIATDIAVMYTTNLGSNWQILGLGFPTNVPCHNLTFHTPTRTLVVWTHGRSAFKITVPPVGITNNKNQVPERFALQQNYPNPFNPSTVIKYSIPESKTGSSYVKISVYDILGRKVSIIVNRDQRPGNYEVSFDSRNISSGIYFYRMEVSNKESSEVKSFTNVKKMILLK